jgi:FMN phosphatase YigB (HAD superfamily)
MTAPSAAPDPVVFLLDVDNTLLDNDRIIDDLRSYLTRQVGAVCGDRYFAIFEELRDELGYADYLGAVQRYRLERPRDVGVLEVSSFLLNYPFPERLFPGALDLLAYLARWGPTVIVTDGDVVFQPWKVERSGLRDAVGGRVLVYVHKEEELGDVELRYPASRYVFVDDKVRLLTAFKRIWGERVTTVFPRQGHYALDASVASYPPPDATIERIADLLAFDPPPGIER